MVCITRRNLRPVLRALKEYDLNRGDNNPEGRREYIKSWNRTNAFFRPNSVRGLGFTALLGAGVALSPYFTNVESPLELVKNSSEIWGLACFFSIDPLLYGADSIVDYFSLKKFINYWTPSIRTRKPASQ